MVFEEKIEIEYWGQKIILTTVFYDLDRKEKGSVQKFL